MQFFDKNGIIRAVRDFPIYDDEYEIIMTLIDALEPAFFSRVFEEILNFNLSFSDFKQLFNDAEYAIILEKNLRSQELIREKLDRFMQFKQNLITTDMVEYNIQNIGLTSSSILKAQELYDEENQRIVDNLIYQLFDGIETKSYIERAGRIKMIEYLKDHYNKNLVKYDTLYTRMMKRVSSQIFNSANRRNIAENNSGILCTIYSQFVEESWSIPEFKRLFPKIYANEYGLLTVHPELAKKNSDGTLATYGDDIIYAYVNSQENLTLKSQNMSPRDVLNKILFFAQKQIVPVEFESQVLDKTDVDFMIANDCNEDDIKKLKSLAIFLRKTNIALEEEST